MIYCTLGNIQVYVTDMIRGAAVVHPTPVHPAVFWDEFVHSDSEEGFSGVVIQ